MHIIDRLNIFIISAQYTLVPNALQFLDAFSDFFPITHVLRVRTPATRYSNCRSIIHFTLFGISYYIRRTHTNVLTQIYNEMENKISERYSISINMTKCPNTYVKQCIFIKCSHKRPDTFMNLYIFRCTVREGYNAADSFGLSEKRFAAINFAANELMDR